MSVRVAYPPRLVAVLLTAIATVAFVVPHFELDRSLPEADSQVESPTAIQLWFTQVPQARATSIRLIDGQGDAVETADVVQDADDGKLQSVALTAPLAPGLYTVGWRSMAADGHVVRGDFSFTVAAQQ